MLENIIEVWQKPSAWERVSQCYPSWADREFPVQLWITVVMSQDGLKDRAAGCVPTEAAGS